ncbi:hypothetical protein Tco_1064562, partial [Tanacetum coccineum]
MRCTRFWGCYSIYALSKNDLKDLAKTYRIPLDLHPRLPDLGFTMDCLPADAIGIYSEFLRFSGVRVPYSTFLLSVLKYFKVHISQPVPLGLNKVVSFESLKKWKNKFFLIDRRAIRDHLTWRHSCSCVSDDLPSNGYDRSVWFNKECDSVFRRVDDNAEISIYDFMTLPSMSDAKITEESHHLSLPLLERVPSHTTPPATEGAIISLPTPDEIVASLPDSCLVKKSKGPSHASRPSKKRKLQKRDLEAGSSAPELDQAEGTDEADLADLCVEIEDRLERDEGVSMRAVSAPTPRLGKKLGAPPSIVVMDPLDCFARSALARDAEYDQISDDDFGTATRGEEIDLTLFPLAPSSYHMPYLYEGVSSPLYTKEEWNGPHASERSILCKDIFKDPDVCRKALDQTITPVELSRTESLLPLELSNRVNVLSSLLVSHGYELNSHYANLVSSKAHFQENLDKKKRDVKLLRSEENRELRCQRDVASEEVKELQSQLDDAKTTSASLSEELTQTDAKLSEQALTVRGLQNELVLEKSKSQGYKDAIDGLREEVTQFVGSCVESLVRKLLSSDEFHAALDRVASLGINYGVERGLRMGCTDVEFEAAVQKVSNFYAGAKADFDKALVDFPTTPFPFLSKIVVASG